MARASLASPALPPTGETPRLFMITRKICELAIALIVLALCGAVVATQLLAHFATGTGR